MPRLNCVRSTPIVRTPRVRQLEGMFDVPPAERSELRWQVNLPLEEREWQIGLIVGPSGCGKSTIARELFDHALAQHFDWPADKSIVDGFPPKMKIKDVVGLLSSVGFSSPPSWLRPFGILSNGEQFRVTIARALAEKPDLVVIDEFTSVVDRTVAQIGSAAIAKAIRRGKARKFVAVSCHYDITDWLDPDWIFDPSTGEFHWRSLQGRPKIQLDVARVHYRAWQLFKYHHYLSGDLNRSAICFLARVAGRPAAFTAVVHSPGSGGGFYRESRTVCLPDFQGIGLGNALGEFVASLFAGEKRYFSTTSHPAMIRHRLRSPLWRMVRKPGFSKKQGGTEKALDRTVATNRLTAGFRYVGPAAPAELRARMLDRLGDAYVPSPGIERVLALLSDGRARSVSNIARRLGISSTSVRHGLDELRQIGRVTREGGGRRSNVFTFRLHVDATDAR